MYNLPVTILMYAELINSIAFLSEDWFLLKRIALYCISITYSQMVGSTRCYEIWRGFQPKALLKTKFINLLFAVRALLQNISVQYVPMITTPMIEVITIVVDEFGCVKIWGPRFVLILSSSQGRKRRKIYADSELVAVDPYYGDFVCLCRKHPPLYLIDQNLVFL